ncbi:hypothetical protein HY500_01530 [Candidatus Woesearchaeota archaeon]|nr:hypothetical protein [Candidatus Woesearchaeota archaeon]
MKKGFFFSIDSIFALILFGFVLANIYSFFLVSHNTDQQFYFSEDMLNIFSKIKINELDLTKYNEIQTMIGDGRIKNQKNTLLEQVVIFREKEGDTSPNAQLFVQDVTKGLIPEQYGFSIDINGEVFKKSKEVTTLISRERLTFGESSTCAAETETCNGVDDDCDGTIDNGVKNACGGCGVITGGTPSNTCDGADTDSCEEGTWNCNAVKTNTFCSDNTGNIAEICDDGIDNNCDGSTDEGCGGV